ncbi:ATP-binding protein [Vibrio sp. PP-XX7]
MTGATGAGKTYVACALAAQACEQLYSVRYHRLSRLLDDLSSGRFDGTYQKQLLALSRKQLLLLDDWGMEKLSPDHAGHLLELLEDRYQSSSTIMISQLPVKEWYNMIGNATVADALLDRLIHNSHRDRTGRRINEKTGAIRTGKVKIGLEKREDHRVRIKLEQVSGIAGIRIPVTTLI